MAEYFGTAGRKRGGAQPPAAPGRRRALRLTAAGALWAASAPAVWADRGLVPPAGPEARDGRAVASMALVLAIDVSASVGPYEYALQMGGVAGAFRDPAVISAIEAHGGRGVAVTLTQWSAGHAQRQSAPWTRVRDAASARAFAAHVARAPRYAGGRTTAIGSAIDHGLRLIDTSPFAASRRVIDVSGDGRSNDGAPLEPARRRAEAAGVTVNGLAILNGEEWLAAYFEERVITGPGAFLETASDFYDFSRAIRRKLLRELSPLYAAAPRFSRQAWSGRRSEGGLERSEEATRF